MKTTLDRINIQENSNICKLGSIVKTDKINYFISISTGKIIVDNKTYYAISSKSPIGQLLIGKRKDDVLKFNGNQYKVDIIL